MTKKLIEYYYFCDGASRNNGGKNINKEVLGSYGGVLVTQDNQIVKKYSKTYKDVTNNQMELLGFIKVVPKILNILKNTDGSENYNIKIHIISDSQYLVKGINEWLNGWKKRGWRNSSGKVVENIQLWKIIDNFLKENPNTFDFKWVKGHSKNPEKYSDEYYNDICDTLANESINCYLTSDNYNLKTLEEEINLIKEII